MVRSETSYRGYPGSMGRLIAEAIQEEREDASVPKAQGVEQPSSDVLVCQVSTPSFVFMSQTIVNATVCEQHKTGNAGNEVFLDVTSCDLQNTPPYAGNTLNDSGACHVMRHTEALFVVASVADVQMIFPRSSNANGNGTSESIFSRSRCCA